MGRGGTGHLKKVLNGTKKDHDFGIEVLKKVPEALASPVAIIASKTKPDSSIVAILDLSSGDKPLLVAVEIDGLGRLNGERIDTNAILSAYTKKNAIKNLLNAAIDSEASGNGGIYYIDKKRASQLLNAIGVQFPGGFNIPHGSVRSITDSKSKVKSKFQNVTQTKQFKRWFGDWETHAKAASKVVNEDGTPRIVYHGTTENFTVFECGDVGHHVGTKAQAEDRINGLKNGHGMELYADENCRDP